MPGQDCIFCRIVEGQIPCFRVYEDDSVLAFLDINPISDGHTLVIPKEHCGQFHECSFQSLFAWMAPIGSIAHAVITAVGAEGYNILCNTGRAAGQLVDHVHLHIIPRKSNDGLFSKWQHYQYSPGQADQIVARIRKHIEFKK